MKTLLGMVLFVLALGACGSQGCSCSQPIKGGYPIAERHEGAMQIRATQGLFQFLSQNGPTVIPKLLPTGAVFNVPPSCGSNKVCCAMPAPMCRLQFDFKNVSITPGAPNVINLNTDFGLKTLDNLPVEFSGTSCNVSIDTTRSGNQTMNLTAQIALPVNPMTDLAGITVSSSTVSGIDDGDVKLDESGSSFLCTIANALFKGFVVDQLQTQVADQLKSTIADQACMKCTTKDDCNAFAAACKGGKCVDGMDACIQELGLESKMDVGAALASFAPGTQASMDFLAVAGGWSVADTGLSLGMLGGGRGDPHSPCVPMTTAPSPAPVMMSATFTTNALPDGTPYHLGIGVHHTELDSLGWGAFDSGALCLHIGTPTVALLSSKTIGLIVPSLADLVHVADAPIYLSMRPEVAPTFTLGKGTFKTDAMGMRTVDDPLMNVAMPEFAIDFWAMVDERYIRVMTLTADLELPVSLDLDMDGKIVPLLGVAVGNLTSALKPIALPSLMGLDVRPKSITSTDPDANGTNQFLSIFADLALAAPVTRGADTEAHLLALDLPPTDEFSVTSRGQTMPEATLELGGRSIDGRPLEYSWSIDDGVWSPFTDATTVTIHDPILWLQGKHIVHVRARAQGLPDSLDRTPAEVILLVDTVPPEGSYDENGNLDVHDRVSPPESLLYRWRLDGEWSAWSPRLDVAKNLLPRISVEAIDEAGNVGGVEFHGRTTNPPSGSGCNCDVGGAPSPSSWLVLLIPLLLFRRKLGLLLLMAGCNEAALTKGDFESPLHEIGRYHDIAVRNGHFHISAYDDSVGDLAYASVTDPAKIEWQYVDGIDPMAPKDLPGDYRHGVSDPGPDVGMYSSIALTKGGQPRIAYYDTTNGSLKYASGPHTFKISTVQSGDGANVKVGLYTQIALDDHDVPTIAYTATGISDGAGGFKSELRLATATTSDPSGESSWKVTVVDSTRIKCAGLCSGSQACIQAAMVNNMPNGDPSQSTCTATTNDCNPACATTEGCIMGTCTKALQAVKGDLAEGFLFTQLLQTKNGLTLVYYDHSQGDLKMAVQAGGAFTVSTLDGGDPATDRGQFASARLAGDGTIHVAYVDALADRLMYLAVPGMPEVVDDGLRDDGPHSVGAGAALYAGSTVEIVYQDQVVSDLLIAKKSGGWTHSPLKMGAPGFGFYPHIVADGGKTWLSHFFYDRTAGTPPSKLVLEQLP